jgi:hypothetical protein
VRLAEAMLGPAHWETVIGEHENRTLDDVTPVAHDYLMVEYMEDVKACLLKKIGNFLEKTFEKRKQKIIIKIKIKRYKYKKNHKDKKIH